MKSDCIVESLISENNRLRMALIQERKVGMRPCALARELKYLSAKEKRAYLSEIKSIISLLENASES